MKEKIKIIYDFVMINLLAIALGWFLVDGIRCFRKGTDYFVATTHLAYHHLEQVGCDAIVGGKVD